MVIGVTKYWKLFQVAFVHLVKCCRFSKEQNLLTLTIEAPHLGPTGSCFKDGSEEQDFRWNQHSQQAVTPLHHQVV